jgi:glycosyltransferase involved in cell wall biosynthesis
MSPTPLRLAVFSDTYAPQVNGVARTLARLVDAVRASGGDAAVFTAADPMGPCPAECARFASVAFWAYPQLRLAHPSSSAVDATLRRFAPTLIHAATPFGMGLAGRAAALRHRVPLVTSYHTSFAAYASYYRLGALARPGWRFLRWFHNSGRRTFCPTQAIANEVAGHGFVRTAVWSRGVDVDRFSPAHRREALRASIGVGPDDVLVLYVGRLAIEKGLAVAVAAARQVASETGRVRFGFVGDGPYADEVARQAPAGSWIPGALHGDALSIAYASADCFVFPSTTDTFGNVLLEAAASGLPIVAADVGPTRELVGASGAARLFPPTDVGALAAILRTLVADQPARVSMRSMARALAESRAWGQVWDRLLADYAEVQRASAGAMAA